MDVHALIASASAERALNFCFAVGKIKSQASRQEYEPARAACETRCACLGNGVRFKGDAPFTRGVVRYASSGLVLELVRFGLHVLLGHVGLRLGGIQVCLRLIPAVLEVRAGQGVALGHGYVVIALGLRE